MKKIMIILILPAFLLTGCEVLQNITMDDIENAVEMMDENTDKELTNGQIIKGLKEALKVGTNNAVDILSRTNGFYNDPILKIPFPKEVQYVEEKLRDIGMGKLVDDFILQMNRGAEKAVVKASPIFANAIIQMSINDAKNILQGPDNAATKYFKQKTTTQLTNAFKPEVQKTLDQMNVTKYWKDVTTAYNKVPFSKKVETDLAQYVTGKALEGLFFKIAQEEKKIRENPQARVTEILKTVFGSLDK